MSYSKEFLIDAYMSRFYSVPLPLRLTLETLAEKHYDAVGKTAFRASASLDAAALSAYRSSH